MTNNKSDNFYSLRTDFIWAGDTKQFIKFVGVFLDLFLHFNSPNSPVFKHVFP